MISKTTPGARSDAFASLPLFHGIETICLKNLAETARYAFFEKGVTFLAQGQPLVHFYVVLEGWCSASKGNPEGQESVIQIFQRGDLLPEPEFSATQETVALNFQALTPIRLMMIPPTTLRDALEQSPSFSSNMLAASVHRCRQLRDHIEQLTLHSAEQRVGRFLLQMRFNSNSNENTITLPFDKSHIASYLGIKPETLSRTLQHFKENGFVIERNHLMVPDRQALCDYCDQETMKTCRYAHTDDCMHSANNDAILA